jgi:endoplasmic reticulum junction formation protein lunapark
LKKLLLEQRSKVEELKKKTDFYSTQKLLERYDRPEASSLSTPVKQPVPRQSLGVGPGARVGPRGSMGGPGQTPGPPGNAGQNPNVTPKAQILPPGINGTPMPPGFMSAWSREYLASRLKSSYVSKHG